MNGWGQWIFGFMGGLVGGLVITLLTLFLRKLHQRREAEFDRMLQGAHEFRREVREDIRKSNRNA